MLNVRQIQILILLWNDDYTGTELAERVNSSRRTIIRDINEINQYLIERSIAQINSSSKYHMVIKNYREFQALIEQFEIDDQTFLFKLLILKNKSIDNLMAETYLSKKEVANTVERLNNRYQGFVEITSKIGKGYQVDFQRITKVDLLAYLIFNNPKLIQNVPNLNMPKINNLIKEDKQYIPPEINKYLVSKQITAQFLALNICQIDDAKKFYLEKIQILNKLNTASIKKILRQITDKYELQIEETSLVTDITEHLCRNNLFPTFISASLTKQIKDIKIKNPFAFDLANDFSQAAKEEIKDIIINDEYIGLYVVRAIDIISEDKNIKILMYTYQRSIANINENILLENINNINLKSVYSKDEFDNLLRDNSYDISIMNGPSSDNSGKFDISINGIINQQHISYLKRITSNYYINKNLGNIFTPSNYLNLDNQNGSYLDNLRIGLSEFKSRDLLGDDLIRTLINREEAGNQLIIDSIIAVPHASSRIKFGSIFAIKLENPVILNNNSINLILNVVIDDQEEASRQIFSYLYKIFHNTSKEKIKQISSYEDLFKILNNPE
ncbi:HTH domain-containing protein [Companilactobacillus keshanensis]|nr:HTH domain-containing protein [Companilactobacillus keshanensis]